MRPVSPRLHEVEEKYDSDCSWNSTDSFAHHLLYSCMGGNLYSYYKCKEIYVSLMKDDVTDSNSKYKEELAEIDMYNIRYLSSKNEIVCNLVKQNIQDERIILELNSKFITMNSSIISFIINDSMIELFTKELGYDVVYESFVIVKE